MNNRLFLALCLISLSGCSWWNARYNKAECLGPNCGTNYTLASEAYDPSALPEICQNSGDPSLCAKDPFVNFTRTPADFRRYGERTPRDQRISQAAAGNNISASIPSSIEDDIVSYQRQVLSDDAARVTEESIPERRPRPLRPANSRRAAAKTAPAAVAPDLDVMIEDECLEDQNQEDCVVVDTEKTVVPTDYNSGINDPVRDWFAEEGQNLKALLTQWSEESGWRLIWNTNRNYVLSAGAIFRGRFADVSSALIRAFARARPAPIATFYNGNRVLVVETMEDENAYD